MPGEALRIIDANSNRAREALRVLEDYARLALNDDEICASIKNLRHGLRTALGDIAQDAIQHRDITGDVGTNIKTAGELTRESPSDVVIAAGKRLSEALRVIEEYLKTIDTSRASQVESMRYRSYAIEQQIARTLRPPRHRLASVRLYVLITESLCRRPWLEAAEQAILGGADCLQLREKELDGGDFLARARCLVDLCKRHNVLSIINDRADIAHLSGADGVHLGQEDLPAVEARKILGRDKIIGVSTHRIEQARQAVRDGADYIGVGPMFRSRTKPRDILPGLDYARQIAAEIRIPAIAIAGITQENVNQVAATGIQAVAVTAAVIAQEDVKSAAAELKQRIVPSPCTRGEG